MRPSYSSCLWESHSGVPIGGNESSPVQAENTVHLMLGAPFGVAQETLNSPFIKLRLRLVLIGHGQSVVYQHLNVNQYTTLSLLAVFD